METSPAAKMFHVLVVMGAALGGACTTRPLGDGTSEGPSSGVTTDTSQTTSGSTSDPGNTVTSTTTTSTTEAPTTGATIAAATDASSGAASTGVIDGPEDCAAPQQLHCESYEPPTQCVCDPEAPLSPDDCPFSQQFTCAAWWNTPPWGCVCDLDAPLGPEACPVPSAFNCTPWEPEWTGCSCECGYGPPQPLGQEDCDPGAVFWCEFEPFGCCCMVQLG